MAHIDLAALQQRLAQQQPKPAPTAESPSWSMRPASALRTTPSPKARPASAAAPGTLRATTTMRAALPLKATNARAERARMVTEMHARELAVARHDALAAQQAAMELRRVEEERRARGLLARLRAAVRGK